MARRLVADTLEVTAPRRRRRRNPRLLTRLNVQGNDWRVYLTNADDEPDLAGADGVTSVDDSLIALDERLEPTRMGTAFLHELIHACLSAPASVEVLARVFECKHADVRGREEALVSYLAPILFDTLARNGLLKLPKVPKVPR
jgi:hypothetical protein